MNQFGFQLWNDNFSDNFELKEIGQLQVRVSSLDVNLFGFGAEEDEYDDDPYLDIGTFINIPVKIIKRSGRNKPCDCGSGKKFQKCC